MYCGFLVISIINSLHGSIGTRANFDIDATLSEIIMEILALFETDSSTDHHPLKQKAEATKLTSETSLEDYIQAHRSVRTKMRNANYPNTGEEQITVKVIINSLDV